MWQLDGNEAHFQSPRLSFQLDLASPASGLTGIKVDHSANETLRSVDATLLQLTLPDSATLLADAYVRGSDLVATYSESTDRPCRTQVYWRYECETEYVGVQLIVSVQTSRLDAIPGFQIVSRVSDPLRVLEEGIYITSLSHTDVCYAELVDRSNIESSTVRGCQITHDLFQGSLEKGVIRRARLLACFLRAGSVAETARRIHEQVLNSSPPLTT